MPQIPQTQRISPPCILLFSCSWTQRISQLLLDNSSSPTYPQSRESVILKSRNSNYSQVQLVTKSSLSPMPLFNPSPLTLTILALDASYFLTGSLPPSSCFTTLLHYHSYNWIHFWILFPKVQGISSLCPAHMDFNKNHAVLCTCSYSFAYINASQIWWILLKKLPIYCTSILLKTVHRWGKQSHASLPW